MGDEVSQNTQQNARRLGEVILRAWTDADYLQRLRDDPAAALDKEGVPVPPGVRLDSTRTPTRSTTWSSRSSRRSWRSRTSATTAALGAGASEAAHPAATPAAPARRGGRRRGRAARRGRILRAARRALVRAAHAVARREPQDRCRRRSPGRPRLAPGGAVRAAPAPGARLPQGSRHGAARRRGRVLGRAGAGTDAATVASRLATTTVSVAQVGDVDGGPLGALLEAGRRPARRRRRRLGRRARRRLPPRGAVGDQSRRAGPRAAVDAGQAGRGTGLDRAGAAAWWDGLLELPRRTPARPCARSSGASRRAPPPRRARPPTACSPPRSPGGSRAAECRSSTAGSSASTSARDGPGPTRSCAGRDVPTAASPLPCASDRPSRSCCAAVRSASPPTAGTAPRRPEETLDASAITSARSPAWAGSCGAANVGDREGMARQRVPGRGPTRRRRARPRAQRELGQGRDGSTGARERLGRVDRALLRGLSGLRASRKSVPERASAMPRWIRARSCSSATASTASASAGTRAARASTSCRCRSTTTPSSIGPRCGR